MEIYDTAANLLFENSDYFMAFFPAYYQEKIQSGENSPSLWKRFLKRKYKSPERLRLFLQPVLQEQNLPANISAAIKKCLTMVRFDQDVLAQIQANPEEGLKMHFHKVFSVTIFTTYHSKDQVYADGIKLAMSPILALQNDIRYFDERDILAGAEISKIRDAMLQSADIIICICSLDFIGQDPDIISRLKEHHDNVIPVFARPINWDGRIKHLPSQKHNSIMEYHPMEDEAYNEIAVEMKRLVDFLRTPPPVS